MRKVIFGVLMTVLLCGCGASGGGTSSGIGSGDGDVMRLAVTQADMKVSGTGGRYSTQNVMATVYGPADSEGNRSFIEDGTKVTFTCSDGGFLERNSEGSSVLRSSVTAETSDGLASVVYAAPTRPAMARLQAESRGAHAWVDVNVYAGL